MADPAETLWRDELAAAAPPECAPLGAGRSLIPQHATRWKTGLVVSTCVHVATFFALGAWASSVLQLPESAGFRNAYALRESLGAPQGFSPEQDLLLPLEPVLVDVPPVGTPPPETTASAPLGRRHFGLESTKTERAAEPPVNTNTAIPVSRADEEPTPAVENPAAVDEPKRTVAEGLQPTERSALSSEVTPGDLPPLDTPMFVSPQSATVGKRHFVLESTKVDLPQVASPAVDSVALASPVAAPAPRDAAQPVLPAVQPNHPTKRAALPLGPAKAGLYAPSAAVGQSASVGTTDTEAPEGYRNFPPIYPETAAREQLEGTVTLRVLVTRDGTIGDLEVFHSSGHAVLDGAAVQAVKDWRYRPARLGNRAIDFVMRVEIIFTLRP